MLHPAPLLSHRIQENPNYCFSLVAIQRRLAWPLRKDDTGQLLVQRSRFHNEVDSTLRRRGRSWVVTGRIRAAAASRDAQALRSCRRFALDDGRLLIGPL